MSKPPIWLLDIDNVVNVDKSAWPDESLSTGTAVSGSGKVYTMQWIPSVVDKIRDIHESGLAEIRWCSTWCGETRQFKDLWNLDLEDATPEIILRYSAAAEKMYAALDVVRSGRRLIWTDDHDIPTYGRDYDELCRANSLLIAVHPIYGLMPHDFTRIRQFCSDNG